MSNLVLFLTLVAVAAAVLLTLVEVHGDDRSRTTRPAPRSHHDDLFTPRNRR